MEEAVSDTWKAVDIVFAFRVVLCLVIFLGVWLAAVLIKLERLRERVDALEKRP